MAQRMIFAAIICLAAVSPGLAGELRYVVSTKAFGLTIDEHYLWSSREAYNACIAVKRSAVMSGKYKTSAEMDKDPDIQRACETGYGPVKPTLGTLKTGAQVELLDSRTCAPMIGVRVLSGVLKSETGCIDAEALSSIKPK